MTKRVVQCSCGAWWEFDANLDPVIMKPWPHWECEDCGAWIPAF